MTNKIKGPIIRNGKAYDRVVRKGIGRKEWSFPVITNVKADRARGRR